MQTLVLTTGFHAHGKEMHVVPRYDPDGGLEKTPEPLSDAQEDAASHVFRMLTWNQETISASLINSTLRSLQRKHTPTSIVLRLEEYRPLPYLLTCYIEEYYGIYPDVCRVYCFDESRRKPGPYNIHHEQTVLQAVMSNRMPIQRLTLSLSCTTELIAMFSQNEVDLLACTSLLKTFQLRYGTVKFQSDAEKMLAQQKSLFKKILSNAKKLRTLGLDMFDCPLPQGISATTELLFANSLSGVEALYLIDVSISEKDLLEVLSRCHAVLLSLELQDITLTLDNSPSNWSRILQQLLSMPCLTRLSLGPIVLRKNIFFLIYRCE